MLNIYILNVGEGSCSIVEFDTGRVGMIDIDNRGARNDSSLTDPIEYYRNLYGSDSLFRFILTHPDMDHMSGLDELAETIHIENFWDTNNNKTLDPDSWGEAPYRREDWERYQTLRDSENNPTVVRPKQYDTSDCCWLDDGITILSPTPELEDAAEEGQEANYHHSSYVLRMEHGDTVVIFGGDASTEAWEEIYAACEEDLDADIFVAPHHGSPNNRHEDAFEAIAPDDVIVSVHEGQDYDYQYYSSLASDQVWSTKADGNIVIDVTSYSYDIDSES